MAERKTDRVLALKSRLRAYLSSVLELKVAMFVVKTPEMDSSLETALRVLKNVQFY